MKRLGIRVELFTRNSLENETEFTNLLLPYQPDLIILAGFLWLLPSWLIQHFPHKIINIHPALLPKFGGKGMHGHHVHEAVINTGEHEHGITIHYVNEKYDEGEIIFSKSFPVQPNDDAISVSKKIAGLEMKYFPEVIESLLLNS